MDANLVAQAKEQMLRNRLAVAKGVATAATIAAAYYLGRSRSTILVQVVKAQKVNENA